MPGAAARSGPPPPALCEVNGRWRCATCRDPACPRYGFWGDAIGMTLSRQGVEAADARVPQHIARP